LEVALIDVRFGSLADICSANPQKRTFGVVPKNDCSYRPQSFGKKADVIAGEFNTQFTSCAAYLEVQILGAPAGAETMWILTVYVLVVVVMELIVVAVGLALDRIYPSLSLTISLSLFFLVLWFGWVIAVHLTKPKHEKSAERVA
jgi:hypothetical protein